MRFAVVSHKGGSGKTTTVVNLAAALAAGDRRVLVVDGDPQGAAGAALGIEATKSGVYELVVGERDLTEVVTPTTIDGVDIITADLDLSGAELQLPARKRWQWVLAEALKDAPHDVVLIDTAPGLGVLPILGLHAATAAIATIVPEYLGVRSMVTLVEACGRARVPLLGIVATMVSRTGHHAEALAALRSEGRVLGEIPRRVAVADATTAGVPVLTYDQRSAASSAYVALAEEVLSAQAS